MNWRRESVYYFRFFLLFISLFIVCVYMLLYALACAQGEPGPWWHKQSCLNLNQLVEKPPINFTYLSLHTYHIIHEIITLEKTFTVLVLHVIHIQSSNYAFWKMFKDCTQFCLIIAISTLAKIIMTMIAATIEQPCWGDCTTDTDLSPVT